MIFDDLLFEAAGWRMPPCERLRAGVLAFVLFERDSWLLLVLCFVFSRFILIVGTVRAEVISSQSAGFPIFHECL